MTTPETTLTLSQTQRREAAKAAREILAARTAFSSSATDVADVIRLAEFILTGASPAIIDPGRIWEWTTGNGEMLGTPTGAVGPDQR